MAKSSNRSAKDVLGRDLYRNDVPSRGRRHYPTLPFQEDLPGMDAVEGTPTQLIRRYRIRTCRKRRSSVGSDSHGAVWRESSGRDPLLHNDNVQALRPRPASTVNIREHAWEEQEHNTVIFVACKSCGKIRSTRQELLVCTGLRNVVTRRDI